MGGSGTAAAVVGTSGVAATAAMRQWGRGDGGSRGSRSNDSRWQRRRCRQNGGGRRAAVPGLAERGRRERVQQQPSRLEGRNDK